MTNILVSAGEASGDLYASELVRALSAARSDVRFFGCAGPKMVEAGVEPVVHASRLAVVGLVEVIRHIPGIYREFRRLVRAARERKPKLAILTDSPDFNLRLAKKLRRMGIPVLYLVAPQVWAWREGRVRQIQRDVEHLLCIFPFEEAWFRERGVRTTCIGHPLVHAIRTRWTRLEFFTRHGLDPERPLVVLLPGSRVGEVRRHLPIVSEAADRLRSTAQVILAAPAGFTARAGDAFFRERNPGWSIQVIEGETSDALAHADVALAASGTVTVEAALLGTPMVTFYRVTPLSWFLGRRLVRVPFLTMVNLIAGRKIVPELMQDEATGERLAAEAAVLLTDSTARDEMKRGLLQVREMLAAPEHPMERAARIACEFLD